MLNDDVDSVDVDIIYVKLNNNFYINYKMFGDVINLLKEFVLGFYNIKDMKVDGG